MKLKVPSLQHMARNWHPTPAATAKALVKLALNSPTFNYRPLFGAVHDLAVLGVPYEQVYRGLRDATKRPGVRDNYLGVLPRLHEHLEAHRPDFVQPVGRRHYPIGRGLMVPFEPPLLFTVGGQFRLPWFSFWRDRALKKEGLSLFTSIVFELLKQDPDLEDARFEILDFSCDRKTKKRGLQVLDGEDIPRLSEATIRDMLAVFAEGYAMAVAELNGMARPQRDDADQRQPDPRQQSFWDDDTTPI
ncbi:hypothetical protein BN1110_01723 [bacterium YEK0313]|nr:hypothetical protein BN1110_01723 [bacterium YEK0313]